MKVLTFLTGISLRGGGPSRSVPLLVRGLAEIGVDVTLMTYRMEDMNTHAIDGTSAKLKILESTTSYQEIESFILDEGFEIIQLQSVWDLRYHKVAKIARNHNIPYIITPRGMLEPWSLMQKRWKKRIALFLYQMQDLNKAACIYTTAEMEAMHVRDLGVKAPVSIINNGIETDEYSCRTSVSGVKKQVLFLSRIHPKKGIELLLEAWKNLHPNFPDWQLLIAGNGDDEYVESLKGILENYGLKECAKIIPPVFGEEKHSLYCSTAVFCLPSFSENFGMVIAEALSCGVPVITTNNTPWLFLNGEGPSRNAGTVERMGWCIDLNLGSLTNALREAMALPIEVLYEMGQKGSAMIKERYHYRSVALKTALLYEWILGGKRPEFMYD